MGMEKLCNMVHGLKPVMFMVMVQISLAAVNVFYKLASNDGMSMPVMVAYRFLFAAATVSPLALYVERNTRPKLTRMVVFQAFLCGLFGGSLPQNLYAQSLIMTSATFASAMINLIPALTFILAVIFRLEKLEIKTMAGKAKVTGTLMCIAGAMLLTFYKGVEIKTSLHNFDLLKHHHHHLHSHSQQQHHHMILGLILGFLASFSCSIGLIFQAKMSHGYPCHYSSTALISIMGSIQAIVFALCTERNWSQWKLGINIRLLSVSFSGIVASGIMVVLCMWCVRMRGPLFVSVFSPLMLVLVVIAGLLFLNEKLHLGSILGALVIVCGLYSVLLGKNNEMKRIAQLMPESSSDELEQQQKDEQQQQQKDEEACRKNVMGKKSSSMSINVLDAVSSPTLLSMLAPAPHVDFVLSSSTTATPSAQRSNSTADHEDDEEMGISKANNVVKA